MSTPAAQPVPPVGFVLSGGGAKGSFSAGALDFLIRNRHVTPDIVTGTSAGSICAAVIAQARTSAEFAAIAAQLRDDIIAMSGSDASFVLQPWLSALHGTAAGDDLTRLVKGKARPPIPPDPSTAEDVLAGASPAPLTVRQGWEDLKSLIAKWPTERKALKSLAADNRSLMLLDPLEAALRGKTPGNGPTPIDEGAVARPGLQLRITVTALDAGRTRYVTETGALVDEDAITPLPDGSDGSVPGVIAGVLASSSVPMVFPPRPIGDDVYVDGGVLRNIPLTAALTLGALDVYLVLADPLDCPKPQIDYRTANLIEVGIRAENTVAFYDQQRRDAQQHLPSGATVTVIDPTVTAISTFETEPGLLTINMDYGWLRACGETTSSDDKTRTAAHSLADRVTVGRLRSWYLEEGLGGAGDAADAALVSARALVTDSLSSWRSLGLQLPDAAKNWGVTPERHTTKAAAAK